MSFPIYNILKRVSGDAPPSDYEAYYPFNGNTTDDESGNGHDGVSTLATLITDRLGNADSAITLSGGTDSGIVVAPPMLTALPCTFTCWVKMIGSANRTLITITEAGTNNDYLLLGTNAGFVRAQHKSGTIATATSTTLINTNVWFNVGGVFRANDSRSVFVNGVSEFTSVGVRSAVANIDVFSIGHLHAGSGKIRLYNHDIDDVRIYTRGLSDDEMLAIYNSEKP